MKAKVFRGISVLCLTGLIAAPASAAPANTLRELFDNLRSCLKVEAVDPSEELTIVFSLKRDGSLLGKPHISYSKLPSDPAERGRFIDSVAAALNECLPTPITDALGGAIAGRRLSSHFGDRRHEKSL